MYHLNIEIKAHCPNPEFVKEKLNSLGAVFKGVDEQVDTYFENPKGGRLKIREGNIENSIIYYERDNQAGPKSSHVSLQQLTPGNHLVSVLANAYPRMIRVAKARSIYFIENVKFHVDETQGLGSFCEIEAIDTDGTFSKEKLNSQCDHYLKELNIEDQHLIEVSYSDLLVDKKAEFEKEATSFIYKAKKKLKEKGIEAEFEIDHLCYRVETLSEYEEMKSFLSAFSDLLVESEVGGRQIASYKFFSPIEGIPLIELPAPKSGASYSSGFEHLEMVIDQSFEDFSQKYSNLEFDWKGASKSHNPELRLKLDEKSSVKFHHQSLETVIEEEKNA